MEDYLEKRKLFKHGIKARSRERTWWHGQEWEGWGGGGEMTE